MTGGKNKEITNPLSEADWYLKNIVKLKDVIFRKLYFVDKKSRSSVMNSCFHYSRQISVENYLLIIRLVYEP